MRKILFAFLFLISQFSFSQTITGVVKEKGSGLPLPFANVFINNTTLGAATDKNGKFEITGSIPQEFDLVASFVGYSTVSHTIERNGRQTVIQNFELKLLEDNLSEVELKAKRDKSWERNLKMFKDVFLAIPGDPFGEEIEILNPWVIDFERVKEKNSINYTRATAQQPLQIVNRALGYELDYYLENFRMLRGAAGYYGQAFYKALVPTDSATESTWKREKELNYRNSIRHLALSLLLKNSIAEGYELFEASATIPREDRTDDFYYEIGKSLIPVKLEQIYIKPLRNGTYRIFLPERIEVHHTTKRWVNDYYTNVYHPISWIVAPSGYFDIDRKGTLLHPSQLTLSGYLSTQRMARALPLDFLPDEGFADFMEEYEVFQSRYITLNNLREIPWLTTNKSFYYPGETIWLGGKMIYQNALMQDTLSRVVYVDVLNEQLKPLYQQTFPIEEGIIVGGLVLSDTLAKGNYLLRAYTRWSMNFGEMDIFYLPFPILNSNEILEMKVEEEEEGIFGELDIASEYSISDSAAYRVMDLVINFKDDFENPVDAEFLLSALEENYAAEYNSRFRLEIQNNWQDRDLPETFDSEMLHPIDYGISIEGRFSATKKKAPLATAVTLVQGDLEDYGVVNSDSSGRFWASGFQFKDTVQIAIAALDEKRRSLGSVEVVPFRRPPFKRSFIKYTYTVTLRPDSEVTYDFSGDYILLDEFVKEGSTENETMKDRNYGYGEPTRQMGPEQLERESMSQILGRLGFNLGTLKFGNSNFGETVSSPLLIVDGSSMPFLEKAEFREILLSYEPSQLLSVKAYSDFGSRAVFGMSGYAGVIMLETKNGDRTKAESDRNFNPADFQLFQVEGFSSFPSFPIDPPSDRFLNKKTTLYWDPTAKTEDGIFKARIKIPYGISKLRLRIEGQTVDDEAFYRNFVLEF